MSKTHEHNVTIRCIVAYVLLTTSVAVAAQPVQNTTRGTVYDDSPSAIAEAVEGDVIVVAPGTYSETVDFTGKGITVKSQNPTDSGTVAATKALTGSSMQVVAAAIVGAVWAIWAFVFAFYTIRGGRQNFMKRLVRSLIAGSIFELLVAVPAHVLARARGYCCAGFGTFWGIAAGISVMLFAFGPAVFVLFARRYGDLRRPVVKTPTLQSPGDGGEKFRGKEPADTESP